MSKMLETIQKTREYLDYIERHYNNVQKAFDFVQEKLKSCPVFYDDFKYWQLRYAVENHDLSKLSINEFIQYRQFFYPVSGEVKCSESFEEAWANHYINNDHHWENIKIKGVYDEITLTHMVIDWIGMSYEFKDTAIEYYNENKEKIILTEDQRYYVEFILDKIYNN